MRRSSRIPLPSRALLLGLLAGAATWASSVPAQAFVPAQVAGARGRRVRLHADTDAFGWTHVNPEGAGPNTNAVGFGFGRLALVDRTISAWGVGLGYVFPGSRAILGTRMSFIVNGAGSDDDTPWDTAISGQFVPYFRWLFLPGRRFRPYLEFRVGVGGSATIDKSNNGSRVETSSIFPVAGAGGGIQLFITHSFSFDAGLTFDYLAPHAKAVLVDGSGNRTEGDYDKNADVVNLALQLGFSVWFR